MTSNVNTLFTQPHILSNTNNYSKLSMGSFVKTLAIRNYVYIKTTTNRSKNDVRQRIKRNRTQHADMSKAEFHPILFI